MVEDISGKLELLHNLIGERLGCAVYEIWIYSYNIDLFAMELGMYFLRILNFL